MSQDSRVGPQEEIWAWRIRTPTDVTQIHQYDIAIDADEWTPTQYPALEIFLETRRRMTKIVGIIMKAMFDARNLSAWLA